MLSDAILLGIDVVHPSPSPLLPRLERYRQEAATFLATALCDGPKIRCALAVGWTVRGIPNAVIEDMAQCMGIIQVLQGGVATWQLPNESE
jgi:hypothetical protein